ncbi:MAG: alanine dehydrogenase [Deltaproteobacteria bacterium]|nr:alanine dehydrogenase [Deltaproteobacteria bacterium]MBW1927951.1 alanine dehydrogenase [Deltaproteobacteria bacterium]MBW2024808.1 alanine dehydrogenase [Deltaproteobacteria bacterium]MBW2124706.1 alanine dehydrogenase [Deltaproteobacteria bacterium]
MNIGVPKEIKSAENRVAATPAGVKAFIDHGHRVFVEKGAGIGSGFRDEEYVKAGARILENPEDIWGEADMIIKVKEPIGPEFDRMRPGQILFTYLHLAADRELTQKLLECKIVGVAYETVQLDDGSLPLLSPMSEVAGRLSIQMGAFSLEAKNGGMGILLSGVSGVRPARVTIIGGGVAGLSAATVAVGMGAQVSILDNNPLRLRYLEDITDSRLITIMSNPANIEEECVNSHLVICSVLIPGAKAPKLITRDIVRRMMPGAAIVDISIDQGGCCETSRPTTHEDPTFIEEGVVHYCVANMPGAVPRTSTIALTNVTLAYGLAIADKGLEKAMADDPALRKGLNIMNGEVCHPAVADTFGMTCASVDF